MKLILIVIFTTILSCHNNIIEIENIETSEDTTKTVLDNNSNLTREYYLNGNVKIIGETLNGNREGEWIYYFENGKVWSKGAYINNLSNGKFTIFDEDGILFMESFYDMGKKTKEIYYKNGKFYQEVTLD